MNYDRADLFFRFLKYRQFLLTGHSGHRGSLAVHRVRPWVMKRKLTEPQRSWG
jgi:hypothetical protein